MGLLTIKCTAHGDVLGVKELPSQTRRYRKLRVRGCEVVCRKCRGCDIRDTCKQRG